jgi:hypothetical protein
LIRQAEAFAGNVPEVWLQALGQECFGNPVTIGVILVLR